MSALSEKEVNELQLLQMSVEAIKRGILADLDGILMKIDTLLPHITPRIRPHKDLLESWRKKGLI